MPDDFATAAHALVVQTRADVLALRGRSLGPSPWFRIEQDRVDQFARTAEDWHWIHNEPERATGGPFGGPIGHAHLSLALLPHLLRQTLTMAGGGCMFYGYDRARFPRPVPVGSAVRMVGQVVTADALADSEQLTINLRLEVDDVDERPACVANAIWRVYRIPS